MPSPNTRSRTLRFFFETARAFGGAPPAGTEPLSAPRSRLRDGRGGFALAGARFPLRFGGGALPPLRGAFAFGGFALAAFVFLFFALAMRRGRKGAIPVFEHVILSVQILEPHERLRERRLHAARREFPLHPLK